MEVSAVERLAVTSVNGSASIPIEVVGAPDGDIDLTIGYSHDDYVSVLEDYALDDPLLGSISLIDTNKIRLHIDPLAPAGSIIEVYAIETLVARISVSGVISGVSPLTTSFGKNQRVNFSVDASALPADIFTSENVGLKVRIAGGPITLQRSSGVLGNYVRWDLLGSLSTSYFLLQSDTFYLQSDTWQTGPSTFTLVMVGVVIDGVDYNFV